MFANFYECFVSFCILQILSKMIVLAMELVINCISFYGIISQLLLLKREKNIGTFSIYFPHIIISCCILKIFFWLIKPFAISILIQSFLYIVLNLLLLKECVALRQNHVFKQGYISNALMWKSFKQHILFIASFGLFFGGLTIISLFYKIQVIGDIFGYLATLIQISQGLPQLISSYKSKSVSGVSHTMIAIWLFVDGLKTVYFIYNEQPFQFILTGSILVVFDLALVIQIFIYGQNKAKQQ